MLILRLSSSLSKERLLEIAKERAFLFLNPKKIKSMEEIMLAHYLAKRSFKEKTNIAKSLHIEFLLWFAGTRDIEKAFEYAMFDNTRDFVLLSFSKQNEHTKGHIIKLLRAKEKKLVIKKKADPLCLERISLSRL